MSSPFCFKQKLYCMIIPTSLVYHFLDIKDYFKAKIRERIYIFLCNSHFNNF